MSGEGQVGGGGGGQFSQAITGGAGAPPASGEPPAGGNGGAAPPSLPDWARGYDPEVGQWAAKKGYKDPGELAKGFYHLEKTWGADKAGRAVIKPADPNDRAAQEAYYKALGRPETPDGYGLQSKDPKYAANLAAALHSAGLTTEQGRAVAEWMISSADETQAAETSERATKNQHDFEQLQREKGDGWKEFVALAARAQKAAEIDIETLDEIEQAIGAAATFKVMAKIGGLLREDPGVGTTGGTGSSPEAIEDEIQRLRSNPDFNARLTSSDFKVAQLANEELSALHKRRHGVT
jgi:hypothetical protein